MGGRTFECLDAVINRYRKEQIVEGHTLALPVCRVSMFLWGSSIPDLLALLTLDSLYFQSTSDTDAPIKSKEVQAEKIYTTLRECREQVGLKKMKGTLLLGLIGIGRTPNLLLLPAVLIHLGQEWKSWCQDLVFFEYYSAFMIEFVADTLELPRQLPNCQTYY